MNYTKTIFESLTLFLRMNIKNICNNISFHIYEIKEVSKFYYYIISYIRNDIKG